MADNNGLTAEELAEQKRDDRFLVSLDQADDPLVAIRLLACEVMEVRRFSRTQNHNSTVMARRIADMENAQKTAIRRMYALIAGLYLVLFGVVLGQPPTANSLLIQFVNILLGRP